MSGFLRPGEKKSSAFGISFDSDRDADAAPSLAYNANEKLALQDQRRRLPVFQHRNEILYLVENHATTVLVGETGSGKTTQVPQYLHEAGWTAGGRLVACTQPRRVAAMTVAARVAEEMGTAVGQAVGYSIRFEDVSTPGKTSIKYCTDGVLLREMMDDPLLTMYSVVIVDEAHERSLATDLLLGLLKKVQRRRPDLRVIIMSATLEAERFAAFFDASIVRGARRRDPPGSVSRSPAILSVEGRTHLTQIHYLEEPTADFVLTAAETAIALHREDLPGDILIFLTGQDEVERAVDLLQEEARRGPRRGGLRLMPVPLYAGLPAGAQLEAFQFTPRGYRKAVVSTNIAETSVTIEGVVFVIDCCYVKQKVYNPITGLEALVVAPVSRAAAAQRAGRAGRIRPGHVLRLCTEEDFNATLQEATVPEIQRSDLSGAVLQLKSLGVDNIMTFDWISPPPAEAMIRALELLYAIGALDDNARLSRPLGVQLAEMPLHPGLGAALLAAGPRGCTQEAVTIAAVLSVQSVWFSGGGKRRALDEAKARFAVAEGDLITYLNVWRGWEASGRNGRWCHNNRLNYRTLLRAADIRDQLCRHLKRLGVPLASCGEDMTPIRKALACGLFTNAVRFHEARYNRLDTQSTNIYRMIRNTGGVTVDLRINPASVLARTAPQYLLFHQVQQGSTGLYDMLEVVTIEPQWLPEVAPHMYVDTKRLLPA